jgi:hypothetical protein
MGIQDLVSWAKKAQYVDEDVVKLILWDMSLTDE